MNKNSLKGQLFTAVDSYKAGENKDSETTTKTGDDAKGGEETDKDSGSAPKIGDIVGRSKRARQFIGNANDKDRQGQRKETIIGRFLGVDFSPRMVTGKDGVKAPKLHPITQEPMITAIVKVGVFQRGTLEIYCPSTFWDKNVTQYRELVTIPVVHVRAGDIIGDPADKKNLEPATMDGIGVDGSINPCDIMDYYGFIEEQIDAKEVKTGRPQTAARAIAAKMMAVDMDRMFKEGGTTEDAIVM